MLFNSLTFLVYFPVVTVLYFALPHRYRWLHLLLASTAFYMAFIPVYVLILAFTIVIDYLAGIAIAGADGRRRRLLLVISIVSNVGILFVFKYFNFFNSNLAALAHFLHWNYPIRNLEIILPIGLSFHTFQAMSYTIEVYRRRQAPERHFGIYALYVMFYPQLVAGPIERPQNLLHQFREHHSFDYERVTAGLRRMLWGMFKKVVIADNLAIIVNGVYDRPLDYEGFPLLLATVAFAVQIYCDFSGYSDIALGSAQVMGFTLMKNFDHPYGSASIAEFWRRWHISLSSWFRDYVYIPLGGRGASTLRRCLNLWAVFLLSGLWHGANWTFIVWGALHGTFLTASILTERVRARLASTTRLADVPALHRGLRIVITFALVTLAWVFFRANSMHDALYILAHLSLVGGYAGYYVGWKRALVLVVAGMGTLVLLERTLRDRSLPALFMTQPRWLRWAVYVAGVWIIMNLGGIDELPFIYFQF